MVNKSKRGGKYDNYANNESGGVARWLLFPSIFILFIGFFSANSSDVKKHVWNIAPFSSRNLENNVLTKTLPVIPVKTTRDAFSLGRIYEKYISENCNIFKHNYGGHYERIVYHHIYHGSNAYSNLESTLDLSSHHSSHPPFHSPETENPDIPHIEMTQVASRETCESLVKSFNQVTKLHLSQAEAIESFFSKDYDGMQLLDTSQTYLQRAAGFLTLTNCAFVVGSILIVTAIVPVLSIFIPFVVPFLAPIVHIIIMLNPLYEAIVYFIASMILIQASFYHESVSHYVAISGGFLGLLAFFYSTYLHLESNGGDKDDFVMILGAYCVFLFGFPAILYNSTMLGFIACCGLFTMLGFSIISYGMCTCIGFHSHNATERSATTSLLFIIFSLVFPHIQMSSELRALYEPFRFGIFSLGGSVYFLATLIISSSFYQRYDLYDHRRKLYVTSYVQRQIYFLLPVVTFFAIGNIYTIPSLVNTAGTFAFIYGMEKYAEYGWSSSKSIFWVFTLFSGVILYWVALFIKTHPDWIITAFNPL